MRELPRLPEGASADEKIKIIYDWLYELQMEMNEVEKNPSVIEDFAYGEKSSKDSSL